MHVFTIPYNAGAGITGVYSLISLNPASRDSDEGGESNHTTVSDLGNEQVVKPACYY
jgi:hypothetical protein